MGKRIHTIVLITVANILISNDRACGDPKEKVTSDTREVIQKAVVRVENADGRTLATGVCVTKSGLVVFRNTTDLRVTTVVAGDRVKLHFADGPSPEGVVVGWSNAWGIAFAKTENGEWPHVPLGRRQPLAVGERCITAESRHKTRQFLLTQGRVTRVENSWFTMDAAIDSFPPVFDNIGRLIGITSCKPYEKDPVQTPAWMIAKLSAQVSCARNLDQVEADSGSKRGLGASKNDATVESIINQTSVRICLPDSEMGRNCWTGTAIGDDRVATCGHHYCSPGTKVSIRFANGRIANGIILGLNPIIDIGLVKIADKGDWPAAEIGSSLEMKVGQKCFAGGYPIHQNELIAFDTTYVKPEKDIWGDIFYTDAEGYETQPGMSGSGIFNAGGALVGIHVGKNKGQPGRHVRIEFLLNQWESLLHPERLPTFNKSRDQR